MQENPKHTPGPWEIGYVIPYGQFDIEPDIGVFGGHKDGPTNRANAALIAAAPMLYEALLAIQNDPTSSESMNLLYRALALAEGRG